MFYLHTSNQLEQLATQYARITQKPLNRVFSPEIVVVQNSGMARYLSLHVANLAGISANTEALFPAEFMWKLLRIVSPDVSKQSECSPDALRFHIMQELTENAADYPELKHYILNNGTVNNATNNATINEVATWALSSEISQLLDQYLFYRSEWIRDWENTEFDALNWQARLWNRCVTDKNLTHWLTLQDQFKSNFDNIDTSLFPERVSFFSMSALSPGYLDLLNQLANKTDVHLYIINPCENIYWGDIASEKQRAKLPLETQATIDVGNPLLASMGTQGRDFIDQLLSLEAIEESPIQSNNTSHQTLLNSLQNDIYNLKPPALINDISGDQSIIFNACHTAMREVEVLHDQILHALDSDNNLAPSDIVVMMPDIEKYAPYIEAIFSTSVNLNTKQALPFSIADRNPLNAFDTIEALNKVMLLSDTRFDVESVFELLDYESIRDQFSLDENQVNQCRKLAKASNIRWGISASYRKQNNLPNTDEHTWKYALDRILLGYTMGEMPDSTEQLFETTTHQDLPLLPFTDIEGSDAIMLANFKCFTDTVFELNHWNQQNHSLTDWLIKIKTLIARLFTESNDNHVILKALDTLYSNAILSHFEQTISFSVFQKILNECLQKITGTEKYLGHGITFCALVPMRSVPFKVVALMGMNDGEFPRQDTHHSFDLMAKKPKKGDRSRRNEDRYLFLESILATRNRLIISYIGKSVQDNSTLPPSVLVSELLDSLAIYTGKEPAALICNHPLQAFSSQYFTNDADADADNNDNDNTDTALFSYASRYLQLHSDNKRTSPSNVFIVERLPELDDEYKKVSLDQLISFFQNPARAFLKQRFSIQTYDEDLTLKIREPFELESFKDREIRKLVMECELGKKTQLLARAKGLLPYGEIGDAIYNTEKQTVETFNAQLPEFDFKENQYFSVMLGEFELHGELKNITQQGAITQQLTSPYFRDYINIWMTHLALNTQQKQITTFYSPDENFTLSAIENASQQLEELLHFYWQGLHLPLNFYPKSAFNMYKEGKGEIRKNASTTWNGSNQKAGEKDKFENWLLHRSNEMNEFDLDEEFLNISQLIFGELYSSIQ